MSLNSARPLRALALDQLRRRTSIKWRTYPDDVLPLWVAEMDTPLAEPIVAAVTEAIALGDTPAMRLASAMPRRVPASLSSGGTGASRRTRPRWCRT